MSTLEEAHRTSVGNRDRITETGVCGCFHCISTVSARDIVRWADGGTTAICPKCGIDALVADEPEDPEARLAFRVAMNLKYFG